MGLLDAPAVSRRTVAGLNRKVAVDPQLALNTTNADPPAVGSFSTGYSGAAASTKGITGGVFHGVFTDLVGTLNTNRYKFDGWPYYPALSPLSATFGRGDNGMATHQSASFPASAEFTYWGTPNPTSGLVQLELVFLGGSGPVYQIFVDGFPLYSSGRTNLPSDTANHNLPITFASAGPHNIRVQTTYGAGFGGVTVGPNDSLWASQRSGFGQIFVIGDSYADGANGVGPLDTWPHFLGQLLGIADVVVDGQGGTGIANAAGGTVKNSYLARLQADVLLSKLKPSIVVVQGSTNDFAQTPSVITANTSAIIQQVRASWRDALLVVTGVTIPNGTNTGGNITASNAVKAAALGVADVFVDPYADLWYVGTGRVSSPTNAGNTDYFMSSDGVHPTGPGHLYIAQQLQRYIARALANG